MAKGALAGARLPSHRWAWRSCCWLCSGDVPDVPEPFFFNPLEDLVLVALLCPAPIPGWSRALVWWEATERPVAAPAPALPLP